MCVCVWQEENGWQCGINNIAVLYRVNKQNYVGARVEQRGIMNVSGMAIEMLLTSRLGLQFVSFFFRLPSLAFRKSEFLIFSEIMEA